MKSQIDEPAFGLKFHFRSGLSRKNYFYPNLPKGCMITQDNSPIVTDDHLIIKWCRKAKIPGIDRKYLEEDAFKSIHNGKANSPEKTCLDFNRSGFPLLEIIGRPESFFMTMKSIPLLSLFKS